jgi:predicted kinase
MVGLPASGKTTRARELETEWGALRLTPDEWMIPLFGESEANGKRDVVEGRFVWLAIHLLRLGMNVILDFGVWSKDERSALRALASAVGASCELVYLEVGAAEQRRRIDARFALDPEATFPATRQELNEFRRLFQAPDDTELGSTDVEAPPQGYTTWVEWCAQRWPTSMDHLD